MAGFLATLASSAKGAVAAKAKDIATQKAKNFVTGKGKGKGGALVKQGGGKLAVDPSNLMGRQVGGVKGGVDIPASRQTINVTAMGSDSPVGSGGSGDIKIVQDISVAVSAIAETMRSGLVLKDKQETKKRKAREKDKRAALENQKEAGKPKKEGSGGGGMNFKVPGVGLLGGIFGFVTKFVFASILIKLVDFAPKLKGVLNAIAGVTKVLKFIFGPPVAMGGLLLQGLISLVDFGYKIVDGAEKIVTNIFGEEGAEKFRTFMENVKNLINGFIIWKTIGQKIFKQVAKNIKNAFKLIKGVARRALVGLKRFMGPGARKGIKGLFKAGKGLAGKGAAKVGGFAAKIFGKAASFIAPGFKAAKPFASKFFSKIPIVGPLVITIVSLLSGEPATQAIFKGLGAALGGALGTLIPIPVLGTLIGETIGVFVGDLLYEGMFGKGWGEAGKKLKDTLMTIFKGGKFVFDFMKNGFSNFISTFMEEHSFKLPGWLAGSIKRVTGLEVSTLPNLLQLYNPMVTVPLLVKSFFGGEKEGDNIKKDSSDAKVDDTKKDMVLDDVQGGKNSDAVEVAKETTYEEGEGEVKFIPVPVVQSTPVAVKNGGGGSGGGTNVVLIDDTELALYGGK